MFLSGPITYHLLDFDFGVECFYWLAGYYGVDNGGRGILQLQGSTVMSGAIVLLDSHKMNSSIAVYLQIFTHLYIVEPDKGDMTEE